MSSRHGAAVSNYYRFSVLNIISFSLLAGNIIILYALRFDAGTVVVGLISAAGPVNLLFTLLGRRVVARHGAVRTYGIAWITRYLLMTPVLLTLIPAIRERPPAALAIIVICAYGFSIAKGIGIAGTRPVVGEIAPANELGKVISTQHLIFNAGGVVAGIVIALVLGADSPLRRYGVLLAIGVAAGFGAASFILRLPEPQAAATGFSRRFVDGVRSAFEQASFRRYLGALFLSGLGVAMAHAFLVMFFKQAYSHADGSIVFFTVCGSVGGSVMALVSRRVADRVGGKALFLFFCALIAAVSLVVALLPPLGGVFRYVVPALVFFFFTMGQFGVFTSTEVYFYAVTDAELRLDLGIVAGLARGGAGLAGGLLGGVLLSWIQAGYPTNSTVPFSIYFFIAAGVMVGAAIQVSRLSDAGAPPIGGKLARMIRRR